MGENHLFTYTVGPLSGYVWATHTTGDDINDRARKHVKRALPATVSEDDIALDHQGSGLDVLAQWLLDHHTIKRAVPSQRGDYTVLVRTKDNYGFNLARDPFLDDIGVGVSETTTEDGDPALKLFFHSVRGAVEELALPDDAEIIQ